MACTQVRSPTIIRKWNIDDLLNGGLFRSLHLSASCQTAGTLKGGAQTHCSGAIPTDGRVPYLSCGYLPPWSTDTETRILLQWQNGYCCRRSRCTWSCDTAPCDGRSATPERFHHNVHRRLPSDTLLHSTSPHSLKELIELHDLLPFTFCQTLSTAFWDEWVSEQTEHRDSSGHFRGGHFLSWRTCLDWHKINILAAQIWLYNHADRFRTAL